MIRAFAEELAALVSISLFGANIIVWALILTGGN